MARDDLIDGGRFRANFDETMRAFRASTITFVRTVANFAEECRILHAAIITARRKENPKDDD